MSGIAVNVERIRKAYRPRRITTLFVGESAPHNGTFFYCGDTMMLRQMRAAVEDAFGPSANFLAAFKSYGWYLDDLVLEPVNQLRRSERRTKCSRAESNLAERIANYKPSAIVSLLRSIDWIVQRAAISAGIGQPIIPVPFPGMGQQARFRAEMAAIIPKLPRLR